MKKLENLEKENTNKNKILMLKYYNKYLFLFKKEILNYFKQIKKKEIIS